MILSIETSTTVCSVALHQSEKPYEMLGLTELFLDKSHASDLTLCIQNLIKHCQLGFGNLKAIAVSEGPGSYTGLRIGFSTAKGLCYSLGIPLITVPTLHALARQAVPVASSNEVIAPMIDARRMEVYSALYSPEGESLSKPRPWVLDTEELEGIPENTERIWGLGNGAMKAQEVLGPALFKIMEGYYCTARTVGELAIESFQKGQFADLVYSVPFYLKAVRTTVSKKKLL